MKDILLMIDDKKSKGLYIKYLEKDSYVNDDSLSYINKLCLIYGSTRKGRMESYRYYFGKVNKVPIWIANDICLFPLFAPKNKANIWFNTIQVVSAISINSYLTKVIFTNRESVIINSNIRTFNKQLTRARNFIEVINRLA